MNTIKAPPVSNPCSFFAVDTRCSHRRFTLERHMLFLLWDTPYRVIPIPSPLYYYCYFFFFSQKVIKHICIFFTFFYPLTKNKLFQLLNFTFSCTLIAFIKGLFFDRRVKIIVLLLASYKTHRLLFPFLCASQNDSKCNKFSMELAWHLVDLHFVLLLLPY